MTRPPLLTPWGAALDRDRPLPEYPRPQLVRDSYLNLNGPWQYAITDTAAEPDAYDGEIVVPFSPETPLSGVGRQLRPEQTLWYRRSLRLPAGFRPEAPSRVLLHFGAVDQTCEVFVNGLPVGGHTGGYLPFHCDVTQALRDGENSLVVAVRDGTDTGHHSRGKQRLDRGGIWYAPQSGIWQTVWVECVPAVHVQRLTLTPLLAERCVEVTVHTDPDAPDAAVTIRAGDDVVAPPGAPPPPPPRGAVPALGPWCPEVPYPNCR
ncbi:sugar-binding domain-containing protein, partial [Micromonospora sp. NPDC004336]